MAFERVPPRRAAGSRGRAPSLIRARQRLIRGPGQSPGAIFRAPAYGSRFVLGDYLQGAIRSGLPVSFEASGFEALGNYATLSGFVSFGFLVLLFSFSVSHLLHYSRINL